MSKKRKTKSTRKVNVEEVLRTNARLSKERVAIDRQIQELLAANQKLVADAKDPHMPRFRISAETLNRIEQLDTDIPTLMLEAINERELRAVENRNENSIARAVKLVQLTLWLGGNMGGRGQSYWTDTQEGRCAAALAACSNLLSFWVCAERVHIDKLFHDLRDRVAWWEVAERRRREVNVNVAAERIRFSRHRPAERKQPPFKVDNDE